MRTFFSFFRRFLSFLAFFLRRRSPSLLLLLSSSYVGRWRLSSAEVAAVAAEAGSVHEGQPGQVFLCFASSTPTKRIFGAASVLCRYIWRFASALICAAFVHHAGSDSSPPRCGISSDPPG